MNKPCILFLDNTYPKAYQVSTLKKQALGGTESSIVKTALILSKHYRVIVAQKFRDTEHVENENLSFIPKKQMHTLNPNFIVLLRKYPLLKGLNKQFPQARLFLWLHTYKNTEYVFKRVGLSKTNTTIICNSNTHATHTKQILNQSLLGSVFNLFSKKTSVSYCYNPIEKPEVQPIKRDVNKLLFFSSPNKGLQQVIKSFNLLSNKHPNLRLYIANPGYKNDDSIKLNERIIILGSLPHDKMMQHVAESLCVFYPQDSFAETFGLIYAEANALGTPVMAHNIGAAREILHANNQLIDANNIQEIDKMLKLWQKKFPQVKYKCDFNDKNIFQQWKKLFK